MYRMALGGSSHGYLESVQMDSRRTDRLEAMNGVTSAVAFSKDGKYLAAIRGSAAARIVDMDTLQTVSGVASWSGGTPVTTDAMFSPDGKYLAVSMEGTPYVALYDVATWGVLGGSATPAVTWNTRGLAFSPDSSILAVAISTTPYVLLYNTTTWARITPAGLTASAAVGTTGGAIRFSPDGTKLAVGGSTAPYLTVYDTTTWAKATIPTTGGVVYDLAWSPDGTSLAVVTSTLASGVVVYNTATWTKRTLTGNIVVSVSCAFTPDGKYLATTASSASGVGTNETGGLTFFNTTTWARDDAVSALYTPAPSVYSDVQFNMQPPRYMRGTVRDVSGNPVSRKVRAYLRSTGDLIGEVMSNATTGNYEIPIYRAEADLVDLQFLTASGELLNDLFFARATTSAT